MTNWLEEARKREAEKKLRLEELSKKMIPLWKENNVDRLEFKYSCGNDSFDSIVIEIYDKQGELVENKEIKDFFDDAVFTNIRFYEAGDGHYIGEAGTVFVRLETNDNGVETFTYVKDAKEEWNENASFTETIQLTDEEFEFIDNYVADFNGSTGEDEYNVNYKIDFVKTDDLEKIESGLTEKFKNFFVNYDTKLDDLGSWHTMEVKAESLNKEDKTVKIEMIFEYTVYKPCED